MHNRVVYIAIVVLCVSLCAGISYSAEKVRHLEWGHYYPGGSRLAQISDNWAKDIEKATNGRIKIQVHAGGTLVRPAQALDSTVKGIADIAEAATGHTPGRFPVMEVIDLPWGRKTAAEAQPMAWALYNKFKPAEFAKVHVMNINAQGPMWIHTKKPVRTLEDLKGMKLRVPGGKVAEIVKVLGGIPVVMSPGETYDALRKGVVDGVLAGMGALNTFKFGEVTQYTTLNYRTGAGSSAYVIMNMDVWNSLSAEDKNAIDKVSAVNTEKLTRYYDDHAREAKETWEKKGHKFIELSKEEEARWIERLAPLYDQYVKERSPKGIPAAEILQWCRDYVKKNSK
jgi:TRAP-type C4-dicarboxylate transport system substrate-binding protein